MNNKNSRRLFFRQLLGLSAWGAGLVSLKTKTISKIFNFTPPEANAMDHPDYNTIVPAGEILIKYKGMSCFLIITGNGTRIITDPCNGLDKEPADIVTVSCGHYSHCTVDSVGGFPYLYKRTEPGKILNILFKGTASRHLDMEEGQKILAGDNYIISFQVEGMNICHLGALGHKLTSAQLKDIGNVDILMVPVGGISTLPVADAVEACNQLNPRIIIPMHYRTGQSNRPPGATVDEFLQLINNGGNIQKGFMNHGLGSKSFKSSELPSKTEIIVL
jgi:L-ascorbate metabolism protein UlaG (beta-lactamase superfamily)